MAKLKGRALAKQQEAKRKAASSKRYADAKAKRAKSGGTIKQLVERGKRKINAADPTLPTRLSTARRQYNSPKRATSSGPTSNPTTRMSGAMSAGRPKIKKSPSLVSEVKKTIAKRKSKKVLAKKGAKNTKAWNDYMKKNKY